MRGFLLYGLTLLASNAVASSSEAWKAHDKEVVGRCVNASQLRDAKPVGSAAEFADDVGYTALLLQGNYPQAQLKNRKGLELCVFDKKIRKAYVTNADTMIMPH